MNNTDLLKSHIDILLTEKDVITVAIDGNCTAGKTTIANEISKIFDCNVFHMDDFFLRPEQRTQKRFSEVGGNVDYERFKDEVLLPLKSGNEFTYRPYDCTEQSFGKPVNVVPKKINIVEGTYSLHTELESFYDFKVFIQIQKELQTERILQRNKALHQRFFNEWIPLEQKYFDETNIKSRCDLILSATE